MRITVHDLVKCARCKNTFIAEGFEGHICTPRLRGSKRIMLNSYSVSKDERGRAQIMAMGMDGITYWLTVSDQESIPIPFNPSDETLHRKNPTDSEQHPQDCLNMSD